MNDKFLSLEEVLELQATQLDSFVSDDGAHTVVWKQSNLGYPTWVCLEHDQPYYSVCAQKDTK